MTDVVITSEADPNVEELVARGVALLNEKKPGWHRLTYQYPLDLDRLDVQSGSRCVTAQLSGFDNWLQGRAQLGLSELEYLEHGFNVVPGVPRNGITYAALTLEWRRVITEMREADAADKPVD